MTLLAEGPRACTIQFGKHKGALPEAIIRIDPSYAYELARNRSDPDTPTLASFTTKVRVSRRTTPRR